MLERPSREYFGDGLPRPPFPLLRTQSLRVYPFLLVGVVAVAGAVFAPEIGSRVFFGVVALGVVALFGAQLTWWRPIVRRARQLEAEGAVWVWPVVASFTRSSTGTERGGATGWCFVDRGRLLVQEQWRAMGPASPPRTVLDVSVQDVRAVDVVPVLDGLAYPRLRIAYDGGEAALELMRWSGSTISSANAKAVRAAAAQLREVVAGLQATDLGDAARS